MKKMVNGVEVDMTAEEVAARLAEDDAWAKRVITPVKTLADRVAELEGKVVTLETKTAEVVI